MGSIIEWATGKKTYAASAGLVVFAWLGVWLGHFTVEEAVKMTFEGSLFSTLRAGVAKIEK